MRRLALLVLLWPCFAVGAEGDELLARVLARLGEQAVVRAQFVQERHVASMPAPVVSRGRMILSRRDGLLWRVEDPVKLTLAFVQGRIIETGADGVRRPSAPRRGGAQAEMGRLIRAITAADATELRADFELQAKGSPERWTMQLTPRRREMARFLSGVQLSGARHLEVIEIHESSGERTVMRMSGFSTAEELEPAERAELTP